MPNEPIDALSPLDGRYFGKLEPLREIFSEAGLMRARVRVECAWLVALIESAAQPVFSSLVPATLDWIKSMAADPSSTDVRAIKEIELRTNHDVKAVEYWIRAQLKLRGANAAQLEWVHFGCTSEDINNLAYALMLLDARRRLLLPALERWCAALQVDARDMAGIAMLARTHGQAASPTTVGKEFANVAARLRRQITGFASVDVLGKMNGAVGNYNAHLAAFPDLNWTQIGSAFIRSLGVQPNSYTTQIEPHDWIAEYCHSLARIDTIGVDFARDMWSYISIGYFKQRVITNEVGSSTMPHKVNPIDFENAEGNFGIASALLLHFAAKLPISRWQRDLSDSTVLRNLGVALGHVLLALDSLHRGMGKMELDPARIAEDLERSWEVLGEAVQTVMRAHGIIDGYDRLKDFSRGRVIDRESLHAFIGALSLPESEKRRLIELSPTTYVGVATRLANGET